MTFADYSGSFTEYRDLPAKPKRDFLRGFDPVIDDGNFADYDSVPPVGESFVKRSRLKLIHFDEILLGKQRRHLVKDLFPRIGIAAVWGKPKCGKSFWVWDVMMHVARNQAYRGRRVHGGPIVYCALEGQKGIEARAAAYRQTFHPPAGLPFYLQPYTLDLVAQHQDLIADIHQQAATPVAIVLDTLNRSLRGSESSDEDMGAYIRAAAAISGAFNCLVIIIHHCGHTDKRMRGHSGLPAAIDAQVEVKRDDDDNIIAEVIEAKDMPDGAKVISRLDTVQVGVDEDGEAITSCVIRPSDDCEIDKQEPLSDQQALALKLLHRAMIDDSEDPPKPRSKHIPTGQMRVVRLDVWRRYFLDGIADDRTSDRTSQDTRRKAFTRASQRLQKRGFIGVWGDFAWPVTKDRTSRT